MAERAEHTPGPWGIGAVHASEDDIDIYSEDGVVVARAVGSRDDPDQGSEEAWANAKLIAAAPDLLAALRALLPAGTTMHEVSHRYGVPFQVIMRAYEAILAAEPHPRQ